MRPLKLKQSPWVHAGRKYAREREKTELSSMRTLFALFLTHGCTSEQVLSGRICNEFDGSHANASLPSTALHHVRAEDLRSQGSPLARGAASRRGRQAVSVELAWSLTYCCTVAETNGAILSQNPFWDISGTFMPRSRSWKRWKNVCVILCTSCRESGTRSWLWNFFQ